jgi:hypothetical protein
MAKAATKAEIPDPLNINKRLYDQIGALLDDLEDPKNRAEITVPQRINSLIAIGRILVMFKGLRKEIDTAGSGSAVRKYSQAFAANAARGGARGPAPGPEPADDTGLDTDDFDEIQH